MRSHALVILFLVLRVITVPAQDTLLLFHPTVENLEVIRNLSEKGLLDLEGIHILGICHSGENYDYHKSLAYLDSIADDSYSLREISAGLQHFLKPYSKDLSAPSSWEGLTSLPASTMSRHIC
jgi:hypothetical protein